MPPSSAVPGLNKVPLGELGTEPWSAGSSGAGKSAAQAVAKPVTVAAPSQVLSFLSSPEGYTVVKAMGEACPGKVLKVDGFKREEKWDAKAGKSTAGATLTHTESPLCEGSFTIRLYTEEDIAAWPRWLAIWRFDATKKSAASVSFYHPTPASLQPPMLSAVMTAHDGVNPTSYGYADVTIWLKETRPAVATGSGTAKGATQYYQVGKDGKPKTGTQEDPAIQKLKDEAARLAAQAAALA